MRPIYKPIMETQTKYILNKITNSKLLNVYTPLLITFFICNFNYNQEYDNLILISVLTIPELIFFIKNESNIVLFDFTSINHVHFYYKTLLMISSLFISIHIINNTSHPFLISFKIIFYLILASKFLIIDRIKKI